MSRVQIGRTVRRLRTERNLSQQALANRLGISASYLNLIEHDQRAVSGTLLIKLAEIFHLDLAMLSGSQERRLEIGLREAVSDPLLGVDAVPEAEIAALAGSGPNAARAVLALYRAWRVAREDAGGIALTSGRRVLLPNEEARDFFDDRANHLPTLEEAADGIALTCSTAPAEMNHAIAQRLRKTHGLTVTVQPLDRVLRRFDPETRRLALAETLPRESRGFHMAFQLALFEARDAVETVLREAAPSSAEAAMLIRVGLLNYVAGAILMPHAAYLASAQELRHDMEAIAARFGVSFEQACHRLSTLQRPGARGIPFFLSASTRRGTCRSASPRRASRLRVTAARARVGWCIPPFRSLARSRCKSPNCPTATPIFASPGPCRAQRHIGANPALSMSWRWAAAWRMLRRSPMPTGSTSTGPRSGSACPAVCATVPTAAVGPFPRWSTGSRSIR